MRWISIPLFALPIVAHAQVPQVAPADEAMQQRIIQLTGDALNWQAQAITAQRQVADLQKQLEAAKKTETPSK